MNTCVWIFNRFALRVSKGFVGLEACRKCLMKAVHQLGRRSIVDIPQAGDHRRNARNKKRTHESRDTKGV